MQYFVKHAVVLLMLALSLCGCSDPEINAETSETFNQTVNIISQSLDPMQSRRFDLALDYLVSQFQNRFNEPINKAQLRLNGLDAQQVFDLYRQTKRQEIAASVDNLKSSFQSLKQKQASLQAQLEQRRRDAKELTRLQVDSVSMSWQNTRSSSQLVIGLKILNQLDFTLGYVLFNARAIDKVSNKTLVERSLSLKLQQPLTSLSTEYFYIRPNMFTDWSLLPQSLGNMKLELTPVLAESLDKTSRLAAVSNTQMKQLDEMEQAISQIIDQQNLLKSELVELERWQL